MKRGQEESDSEDDEFMTSCGYGGEHGDDIQDGAGKPNRKKRRGVIEKKRRDRINGSLSELKRLVPQAFEKQGSTKLEKAEILQLTVEHIRLLNSKGMTGYSADPSSLAMDYRGIGYRECVGEVARYLAAVEGMDFNDPLRLRLLGHLEAYNVQRDATAKANIQGLGSWNTWSGLHGSNSSFGHSKLSYGFSAKSGLSQFSLIGSGPQSGQMDNAYLAASRLGSAIGLGNHVSPMTPSTFTQLPQSAITQPTGNGHFAMTPSQGFTQKYGTTSAQYGHGIHAHAHMKHISDIKSLPHEYAY